jgi:hypothetical protein
MTHLLLKEIAEEKLRTPSEYGYIQRVQQMADKSDGISLSFAHFIGTGRIYPRDEYFRKYGEDSKGVNDDTQMVVVYMGNEKIDMLFNGTYKTKLRQGAKDVMIEADSPKKLERGLYERVCNNIST